MPGNLELAEEGGDRSVPVPGNLELLRAAPPCLGRPDYIFFRAPRDRLHKGTNRSPGPGRVRARKGA